LGGGEVRLLDHVNAFASLADGGIYREKTAILRIEDSNGKKLEEYKNNDGDRVIEEKYVAMLDHVLSTNDYRAPVFGANNPLRFDDRPVVAKTGTTNEWRDGWTIGYTPSIAVGVWAGNNDNAPMKQGADGSYVASPIWRSFMDQVLKNYTVEQFPKYEKEKTGKNVLDGELDIQEDIKVCEIPNGNKDGKYCLANDYCTDDDVEKKSFANVHNILYYVKLGDPRGEKPENPKSDSQYQNWEKGVEKWYDDNKKKGAIVGDPPTEKCQQEDFKKNLPSVSLSINKSDDGSRLNMSAQTKTPYGLDSVRFYVDNESVSLSGKTTAVYAIPADKIGNSVEVRVVVRDKNGNEADEKNNITL